MSLISRQLPSVLYSAPEIVVGSKMANALLSRLVVLNPSAQQHLLPHLLVPRTGVISFGSNEAYINMIDNRARFFYVYTDASEGLFDVSSYRQFILPVVSRIFGVRDAQVRLVLLHYFSSYVHLMDRDQLVEHILPEVS